ncbi:hypothetical protein [Chitinophaga sp. 212800010-3]|uniref:hypothetical protein n=1 Tax=unclassified Chitinophaga TaxID=2619133 RepID=UPI002DE94C6D|nr:DUF4397 domain-containing protein [Chitinophaga sp. 212800010-3]
MKRTYSLIQCVITLLVITAGCKRDAIAPSPFANAYTRIVVVDAPGNGKVQFLLDGRINANGDSTLYNADGTVYQPDSKQGTTTTVNYPSGGCTDNSPVNFSGTYGFSNKPGSTYATFPNPTNRIGLAPILDNINFYNWAALPAAHHQLSFYSVINASVFGNPVAIRGDKFFDQSVSLEGGAVQTFFLLNKAPVKQYVTIENTLFPGLPIYTVQESINHLTNHLELLVVKDHPDKLPRFKDSTAYIRFVNVTPVTGDQMLNQTTESLDIYIAPIYGLVPDYYTSDQAGGGTSHRMADSIGGEILVTKGLTRYQSTVDAPFFELDVAANMRVAGDWYAAPASGQPAIPRYYRVLAYRSGQSRATNDFPVAQGDWLAVYNKYHYFFQQWGTLTNIDALDSWLVRSDGTNYHPSICTILLAAGTRTFKGPDATGASRYLGFRSCINYQPAGVNSIYFSK